MPKSQGTPEVGPNLLTIASRFEHSWLDAGKRSRPNRSMSEQKPTAAGRSATETRREREAEALRANLRKRKDQQRARERLESERNVAPTGGTDEDPEAAPSGGEPKAG
jgi:hypothetical protein